MQLVKGMPNSGSFVEVWEYEGRLYSDTYEWVEGVLHQYRQWQDDWTTKFSRGFCSEAKSITYIIKEINND